MQMHPTAATLVRKEIDETMQIGEKVHGRHFGVASVLKLKVALKISAIEFHWDEMTERNVLRWCSTVHYPVVKHGGVRVVSDPPEHLVFGLRPHVGAVGVGWSGNVGHIVVLAAVSLVVTTHHHPFDHEAC